MGVPLCSENYTKIRKHPTGIPSYPMERAQKAMQKGGKNALYRQNRSPSYYIRETDIYCGRDKGHLRYRQDKKIFDSSELRS